MRRYLVVAHKTLGGDHLLERVKASLAEGPCQFHFLVPATHPTDHSWTEAETVREAQRVLDAGLERFRGVGADADGEVGDANPVYAIRAVLRRDPGFDAILLSTLPSGPSRWLKLDVPNRVAREFPELPVIHVVAEPEHVG